MKQAKKLIRKNWLLACILAILILSLAIYIPIKIQQNRKENKPSKSVADVKASEVVVAPDTRSEVVVPILMYHHIRNYNDPNDKIGTNLSVPPENFRPQIDYLKNNGYATITFADFLAFPAKKLPEKPIILTFDDGYNDAYTNAYSALKANGQVGVFYIISGFLGRPDQLTTTQVREMSAGGMEIGSHTIIHPDLTKLSSAKLSKELVDSKAALESITGKTVTGFCYPAGQNNAVVDAAVRNAGYLTATTTDMAISSTSENKYSLSRLRINPTDSLTSFADKIINSKRK